MKKLFLIFIFLCSIFFQAAAQYEFPFQDPSLPMEKRVDNLVSQLTIGEKIDQLLYEAPAVDRLGVPKYNWWNECLHGVARAGLCNCFFRSRYRSLHPGIKA